MAATILGLVRVSLIAGQSARRPWQWDKVSVFVFIWTVSVLELLLFSRALFGHIRCLLPRIVALLYGRSLRTYH